MAVTDFLRSAVKTFEGLSLIVAGDAGGNQKIGWGHDLTPAEKASGIYANGVTEDQADTILEADLDVCDTAVTKLGWTLTQGQQDALDDFTYECGPEALAELAVHGQDAVTIQLPRWVHARNTQGVEAVLPGMVSRRAAEVRWWLNGEPTGSEGE